MVSLLFKEKSDASNSSTTQKQIRTHTHTHECHINDSTKDLDSHEWTLTVDYGIFLQVTKEKIKVTLVLLK